MASPSPLRVLLLVHNGAVPRIRHGVALLARRFEDLRVHQAIEELVLVHHFDYAVVTAIAELDLIV